MTEARATILIVDNERVTLRMLHDVLEQDHHVLTATSGEEALRILSERPVDAILADQVMPHLSGADLLHEAMRVQPRAVRILLTASERTEDAAYAVNVARVHRFLVKPVRMVELQSALLGALREEQLQRENERLMEELQAKERQLEHALQSVQDAELTLNRTVDERTRSLKSAINELSKLAARDGLTGLYNHQFFQDALNAELARAARYRRPVALLFIDVDLFKNYNDQLGHQAGDLLLKQLSAVFSSAVQSTNVVPFPGRASDLVARYGGEEFTIILPETDRPGATVRAERIRQRVEEFRFAGEEVQPGGKVTVSIGVAAYPEDASTRQDLIGAADRALLYAKREGRNRVCSATEVPAAAAAAST